MIRLYMPTRVGSSLKGLWETSRNQTLIVCLVLDAGNVRKTTVWCSRCFFTDDFPQVQG